MSGEAVRIGSLDDGFGDINSLERQLFLGFPLFIFIYRWIKKNASPYTRASLIVLGVGLFLSRQLKGYMGYIIKEYMMSSAEVQEGDEVYSMLLSWISRQSFSKNARNFKATAVLDKNSMLGMWRRTHATSERAKDFKADPLNYTPSTGTYPFWHKGSLYFFKRELDQRSSQRIENLSISCFGRNPHSLKTLLEECRHLYNKRDEGRTIIYNPQLKYSEGHWVRGNSRKSRRLETIVLDAEIKATVIRDLENYLSSKQQLWYAARGIPYRRGYLLYGPPGTGKSSLSFAIAGYFKLKIFVISLNNSKMNEEILAQLFASLPKRCIALIEDVDSSGMTQKRTDPVEYTREKTEISLSALLNVIDGVASQEGRILIMTTNYIGKLDAALIRPGRVDMMIEFKNADEAQIIQVFEGIYGNVEDDTLKPQYDEDGSTLETQNDVRPIDAARVEAEKIASEKAHAENISILAKRFAAHVPNGQFTPAELQGYLLRWKDDPETAVENAATWVKEVADMKAAAAAAEKEEEEATEIKNAKTKAEAEANAFKKIILQHKALKEFESKGTTTTKESLDTTGGDSIAEKSVNEDANSEKKIEKPPAIDEDSAVEKSRDEDANSRKKTENSPVTSEDPSSDTLANSLGDHNATIEQRIDTKLDNASNITSSGSNEANSRKDSAE